jgi:hypothetical protein
LHSNEPSENYKTYTNEYPRKTAPVRSSGAALSDGLDETLDLPLKLRAHWNVRMSHLAVNLEVLH